MGYNKDITSAVQIVLFLSITHKAATVKEIAQVIHVTETEVMPLLCLLQQAKVLIRNKYEYNTYQLCKHAEEVTLKDITRAVEENMPYELKTMKANKKVYFV